MKQAIGYIRISDEDQSRWSTGGQLDLIKDHCIKNDINMVASFTDDGESAKNFDRPNWKELYSFVQKNYNGIDYLIVAKYDRFGRNTSQALQMIEKLEQRYHIRVISIMEPLHMHPDSPYYHHFRSQILQNAELELRIIRDRTLFGIHNAQKQGRYTGKAPVGYLNSRDKEDNPALIINPVIAPVVKEIYDRFLSGHTISAIRSAIKEKRLIIKGNSAIQRLLQNPVYMGYISKIAYYDTPTSLVKGLHEPIISEDTWWQVQSIFNNKKKLQQNSLSEDFPLRGVLKCFCDRNYTAAFSRGNGGRIGYYKCNTHTGINLNAKKIHAQFDQLLQEMSLSKMHIQFLQDKIMENINTQLKECSSSSETFRRQVAAVNKKIDAVEEKFITEDIDKATYTKWKSIYHTERSSLQQQLSAMEQPIEQIWKSYQDCLGMLGSLHWVYNASGVEDKHGIIREVFNNQLTYHEAVYRTTYLMDIFQPKALILKEKRLLIYEPPLKNSQESKDVPLPGTQSNLSRLLAIISKLKAA